MRFSIPFFPLLDDVEDPAILLYCGFKHMKLSLSTTTYNPFKDLHEGDFLLACPCELEVYLVWMGKTHSDVVKDGNDEHYQMMHVQWWVPFKKGTCNDVELYQNCWEGKWKCKLVNPMQWVDIDYVVFSFPTRKNTTMNNVITISDVHASRATTNINVANDVNYM